MNSAERAERMREYRKTERGRLNIRVTSRAQSAAVKWVRRYHPEVWSALLDKAWESLTHEQPEHEP